jgi:hypothetical protein
VILKTDLFHHLEQAVQDLDADSISLAHNMFDALLEQLYEIGAFTERFERGGFGRDESAGAQGSWRRRSASDFPPKGLYRLQPGKLR